MLKAVALRNNDAEALRDKEPVWNSELNIRNRSSLKALFGIMDWMLQIKQVSGETQVGRCVTNVIADFNICHMPY